MFTVTFYSYKGGVGRTLALANVAYALATEGTRARVVMVDFDVEAPSLDTLAQFAGGKGAARAEFWNTSRSTGTVPSQILRED